MEYKYHSHAYSNVKVEKDQRKQFQLESKQEEEENENYEIAHKKRFESFTQSSKEPTMQLLNHYNAYVPEFESSDQKSLLKHLDDNKITV